MREDALLTGPLEPTNQWYAIAKIAGIKLCQAYRRQYGCDFISAMPTNLYGPGDNFDLESSHVVPALIAKAHRAKLAGAGEVEIWGTGRAAARVPVCRRSRRRAGVSDGALFRRRPRQCRDGSDVTIRELAEIIQRVVGFKGALRFDHSKPDGTPRKLLDVSKLTALGWTAKTPLEQGLAQTYRWFLEHEAEARGLAAPAL